MAAGAPTSAQRIDPVDSRAWAELRAKARQSLPERLARQVANDNLPDLLLGYQQRAVAATALHQLVVIEKSRRIGITWGIAADAVLHAGAARSAGGMDVLYIGYNLDMAREFVDVCAMWARAFSPACSEVQEFLFEDLDEHGDSKQIRAFRIAFASGFEIVALTSKPRSLRGRQGYVIFDEAAFHDDLDGMLKAAMALFVWGGKLVVVSTHDGEDNPFNRLIEDIRAGRRKGHVERITFEDALADGLYERICLVTGKTWSAEAEAAWAADIYAFYGDDAREELDAIPSKGGGAYIAASLVALVQDPAVPLLRLGRKDAFAEIPEPARRVEIQVWLEEEVAPVLDRLDPRDLHALGMDFARSGHLSVIDLMAETPTLTWPTRLQLEMRNIPFAQQRQVLFFVAERTRRLVGMALDASGNGEQLAEDAKDRFGASQVHQVKLSTEWYRENMPRLKAGFEDRRVSVPADRDTADDYRLIVMEKGVAKPADKETTGADGGKRHADAAMAKALGLFALAGRTAAYGYEAATPARGSLHEAPAGEADDNGGRMRFGRGAW
jgi:phage FluMu gp28-like protein